MREQRFREQCVCGRVAVLGRTAVEGIFEKVLFGQVTQGTQQAERAVGHRADWMAGRFVWLQKWEREQAMRSQPRQQTDQEAPVIRGRS